MKQKSIQKLTKELFREVIILVRSGEDRPAIENAIEMHRRQTAYSRIDFLERMFKCFRRCAGDMRWRITTWKDGRILVRDERGGNNGNLYDKDTDLEIIKQNVQSTLSCTVMAMGHSTSAFNYFYSLLDVERALVMIGELWIAQAERIEAEAKQKLEDRERKIAEKKAEAAEAMQLANELKRKIEEQEIAQEQARRRPTQLDTTQAQEIFQRAIQANLMEQQGEGYKWTGSHRECVYFARQFNVKIWDKPAVTPKNRMRYGKERISWRPFEQIFAQKNFAQGWTKIEREECDYPNIDRLFE